jgi:hypothetical protein
MRRFRVPLAGLMLLLVPFAVGMAALHNPTEVWASTLFTLAILTLLIASLGAIGRRGRARMPFIGFTLFGASYLALVFSPSAWINSDRLRPPALVTVLLLDWARSSKLGASSRWEEMRDEVPGHINSLSFGPADLSAKLMPPGGRGTNVAEYVAFDVSPYKQIAHTLMSLTFGVVGSIASLISARQLGVSPALRIP